MSLFSDLKSDEGKEILDMYICDLKSKIERTPVLARKIIDIIDEEKLKSYLIYDEATNTIRQFPENYLIAVKDDDAWICKPDLAANEYFVGKIAIALLKFSNKYGDAQNLIENVNNK